MEQHGPDLQLRHAARRVPRYTSYPAANHFSGDVTALDQARWLGAVDVLRPVSIYVHIPFCRRLCRFCACRTQGTQTGAPVAHYLDRLEAEIRLVAAALPGRARVGHLHLGGGTPTILAPDQLRRLRTAIGDSFDISGDTEIAVEIDPTELDDARLDALAEIGVTRASIGVQDFAPEVQEAIGRPQSVALTEAAVAGLRSRGIGSLNVDLVYGLPAQTTASLTRTLEVIEGMAPDRVALFGYAHVPWVARRQRLIPAHLLPSPEARLGLLTAARARLVAGGMTPVGIDHFARPHDALAVAAREGRLARNFQGYTTDRLETLIGLGASAISTLPGGYVQNDPRTAGWHEALAAGRLPGVRGHALTAEDRVRGALIERLLCDFEADLGAIDGAGSALALALGAEAAAAAARWPDLVTLSGGVLRLRHRDGRFARLVATAFDPRHSESTERHSLAV